MVAQCPVPGRVTGSQAHGSMQDLQSGLSGALVFVELLAGGQGDQGLAKCVLMAAVDGVGTAPAGGFAGHREVLVHQFDQRRGLHDVPFTDGLRVAVGWASYVGWGQCPRWGLVVAGRATFSAVTCLRTSPPPPGMGSRQRVVKTTKTMGYPPAH